MVGGQVVFVENNAEEGSHVFQLLRKGCVCSISIAPSHKSESHVSTNSTKQGL